VKQSYIIDEEPMQSSLQITKYVLVSLAETSQRFSRLKRSYHTWRLL